MDVLSSAVGLKVDFDMALLAIASGLYRKSFIRHAEGVVWVRTAEISPSSLSSANLASLRKEHAVAAAKTALAAPFPFGKGGERGARQMRFEGNVLQVTEVGTIFQSTPLWHWGTVVTIIGLVIGSFLSSLGQLLL